MRELTDIHIPFIRRRVGRFPFLLITIVLTFLLRPLLTGFVSIGILMDIFFTGVLVSAVYAVSEKRGHFIIALVFVVPALTFEWFRYVLGIPSFELVGRLSGAIFVAYALVLMLSHILRAHRVTRDLIMAAVSVYFLIGLMWAYMFFSWRPSSPARSVSQETARG